MSTECNYLYGVMPADKARSFGPIGIDGGEVRVVTHGVIAMVTSRVRSADHSLRSAQRTLLLPPEETLQYLAEHQRVLERVMTLDTPRHKSEPGAEATGPGVVMCPGARIHSRTSDSAVIPLKFGTFADDDQQILGILQSGQQAFADALEEYAGKCEWDLVACWADLQTVLSEIAAEPAVASMKAEVSAHGVPTTEQRIRLGRLVREMLTRRRDRIAAEVVAALRAKWPEIVVNPTKDDAMILHAAVLIGRDEESLFDRLIDRLNRDYEDRLDFRCVGPLPPYSFATAEVRAVDAEELDAARQLLGVGERLSPAEIKAAYRRVLPEVHPDRNPGADAAERMKELVAAHQLLEEYALNCNQTPPADEGRPVIVKIRTLPDLRARAGVSRRAPDRSARSEPLVAGAR